MTRKAAVVYSIAAFIAVTLGSACALAEEGGKHTLPAPQRGGIVVGLCDGETSMEVTGVKPGQPMGRKKAQAVSSALMAEWRRKHPEANWDDAVAQADHGKGPVSHAAAAPAAHAPNANAPAQTADVNRQEGVYENYTARDQLVWAGETQKFIDEGNAIFHSADKLGGTISVSCDMCHPNGANTHPETYPKYQVQLQRVALLRDMINWCVENPVKGKPLADDDRRLRAMEAYLLAQRKGVKLEYGKH